MGHPRDSGVRLRAELRLGTTGESPVDCYDSQVPDRSASAEILISPYSAQNCGFPFFHCVFLCMSMQI